jgi:hypothetical protein
MSNRLKLQGSKAPGVLWLNPPVAQIPSQPARGFRQRRTPAVVLVVKSRELLDSPFSAALRSLAAIKGLTGSGLIVIL